MADIAAFPDIDVVLVNNGPTFTFVASAAITKGQAVCFNATGVSMSVEAGVAGAGAQYIGCAVTSQATVGGPITVALPGSICFMANAGDTAVIDAGDFVIGNDNTVKGTISAAGTGAATQYPLGIAIDDIGASGTGRVFIFPAPLTVHA